MICKLLFKLKLYFRPPKTGEVYYADSMFVIIGRKVEQVLHGMRDKNGDSIYETVLGDGSYRLTIQSGNMLSYYICKSEVLVRDSEGFKWLSRSQPRRIPKDRFLDMVLDGTIKRG